MFLFGGRSRSLPLIGDGKTPEQRAEPEVWEEFEDKYDANDIIRNFYEGNDGPMVSYFPISAFKDSRRMEFSITHDYGSGKDIEFHFVKLAYHIFRMYKKFFGIDLTQLVIVYPPKSMPARGEAVAYLYDASWFPRFRYKSLLKADDWRPEERPVDSRRPIRYFGEKPIEVCRFCSASILPGTAHEEVGEPVDFSDGKAVAKLGDDQACYEAFGLPYF